uniref:CD3 epsilon n=1 Tax=Lateolabrax japonicus TaxID=8164 RepID=A0A1B0WVD5_LATJA|nr:CD3 epsilon [Lateolabrax japonicus]
MNSLGVGAVLVLLLFTATVKAAEGGVEFSGENFTMICPQSGDWFYKDKESIKNDSKTISVKYDNSVKGSYHCSYEGGEKKYYFYVKGNACANCFELDPFVFGLAIVLDVLWTICVMFMIFKCTKKKSSAGFTHASKAPARSGGRAPPVPSPDYEQLNPHTRSQETYSIVNSRTG